MMSRIGKEHPHHNHHSHIQHVPHMEVPPATSMMAGTADVDVTVVAALVGRSLRPHSTPATLVWLEENYEIAQGVCVPRNTLYVHYVDFCAKNGMTPVNAASFGKIIRQQFPQLTTRRLGTRGQSRYHYYGIAIRESSAFYELAYSKKGLQAIRLEDMGKDLLRQNPPTSCSTSSAVGRSQAITGGADGAGNGAGSGPGGGGGGGKIATRLPEFPSLRDLCLPPSVPEERIATFIVMYRAHCQRLLDTIIRASFDEVQTFLLHYWQGMPPHLIGVLGTNVVVNIVGVCDSILYRSVCNILMSSIMRALPETLIQIIRKFAFDLDSWLREALKNLPENLRAIKMDLARHFCHILRRQTSLNHLFQTVRLALHEPQVLIALQSDWQRLDLISLVKTSLAFFSTTNGRKRRLIDLSLNQSTVDLMIGLCVEFERLVQEQAPLEAYTEWMESIVNRCVLQSGQRRRLPLRTAIRQFLAVWMAFGSYLMRQLTMQAAPGFGTFHLMRVMFDDCFLYLVELLHIDERARELMHNITLDVSPEYPDTDYEGFLSSVFSNTEMSEITWTGRGRSPDLASSTPHTFQDVIPDETNHIDGSMNGEDSSSDGGAGQHTMVGEFLPAIVNRGGVGATAPSTTNGGAGDGENCTSYEYSVRHANGFKFNGAAANDASVCNGYAYPCNGAASQLTYYQSGGFDIGQPEYGTYASFIGGDNGSPSSSAGQYEPTPTPRRDFNGEHCALAFYPEQGNAYPTAPAINNSGAASGDGHSHANDYYVYEVVPTTSASATSSASFVHLTDGHARSRSKKCERTDDDLGKDSIGDSNAPVPAPTSAPGTVSSFPLSALTYIRS